MSQALHVAVRLLHVTAMALLTGGAALLWLAASRHATDDTSPVVSLAAAYEWLFWGGVGVLVATGVGNLGALAPAVPSLATRWGLVFAVKLSAVLLLLLGSAVRTAMVGRLREGSVPRATATRLLARGYGATTLSLVGLVALAEVLAHG